MHNLGTVACIGLVPLVGYLYMVALVVGGGEPAVVHMSYVSGVAALGELEHDCVGLKEEVTIATPC